MKSEVPALEAAAARVRTLHGERAALLEQLLAAEDELIRQSAAAHRAEPWTHGGCSTPTTSSGKGHHRICRTLEEGHPEEPGWHLEW